MKAKRTTALCGACAIACATALACSAEAAPPPIGDDETVSSPHDPDASADAARTAPSLCATPAPGCPCADAGAALDCGLVYRVSGSYVSCSPGVMTCADDGGWGACLGPLIYGD